MHAWCTQARYADSIESLVRNNIQKIKTDMANEVIDAGRFDMETTMAERKNTLESMLQACALPPQTTVICCASMCCPTQKKLCCCKVCRGAVLYWSGLDAPVGSLRLLAHYSLANGTKQQAPKRRARASLARRCAG